MLALPCICSHSALVRPRPPDVTGGTGVGKTGVSVGGTGIAVGGSVVGVSVGSTAAGVSVARAVCVGTGIAVSGIVGEAVSVAGIRVQVGGCGIAVGSVGWVVLVGIRVGVAVGEMGTPAASQPAMGMIVRKAMPRTLCNMI